MARYPAGRPAHFLPASVTPSGGTPISTRVNDHHDCYDMPCSTTIGPSDLEPMGALPTSALAGVLGLAVTRRKVRRWNHQLRLLSWGLLLASLSLAVVGCGGGGNNTPSNPGTPAGTYSISVSASDSAGGPQHSAAVSWSFNRADVCFSETLTTWLERCGQK